MNPMTYATVCSGIECMSVACRGIPLKPVFFSEIEPFPCAVLKAHYPDVPNLGDMSKIRRDENGNITNGTTTIPFPDGGIDILAAGCPCQDFSVAGKRAGGAEGSGTRSSLIFEFIRIIGEIRPRWFIYENVVGMLSTNEGRDFAHILLAFRDCGYSVAYRTLDAQYVRVDGMERAVPQRRRRVWCVGRLRTVGCAGADESVPAEILFEPDCVAGHTPPRRRTGEGFAYSLTGRDRVDAPMVGGAPGIDVLNFQGSKGNNCVTNDGSCPNLNAMHGHDVHVIALDGDKLKPRENRHGVAYGIDQQGGKGGANTTEDIAPTVLSDSHGTPHGVAYGMDARNTGLYGAGATGEEVSMTQDANQCKDGKCVVLCADGGEVASTITRQISEQSGQDNRANAVVVSMAQNTRDEVRVVGGDGQIAGALPAEPGMKQQTYVVSDSTAFKLDSTASNSMKSANPNSGFHETQVAACLDTTTPDPSKGQGGNVIISTNSNGEVSPTLSHKPSALEPTVAQSNIAAMRYIVRRLTPTECERLMGLPDGYTIPTGLRRFFDANGEPAPELVAEFQRIFDTFGAIMADYAHAKPPKPKSAKQVAEWLKKISDPATCPDSPRYKACGNGWATNQPRWILTRLLNVEGIEW